MADTAPGAPASPPPKPGGTVITPPRRGPGHRGQDIRDTVAEMAAKAQEISMEAGSKMAAAMKDVITAAAGLSSFAIESARDLVQYMVRRGQMTQDEADKLIREVEDAQRGRGGARPAAAATRPATTAAPVTRTFPARSTPVATPAAAKPARTKPSAARPAHKPARKPAAARASAKSHAKKPARPAKKPAAAARKSTAKVKRR